MEIFPALTVGRLAFPYSRGGNVSTSGFKQTPHARELHYRRNCTFAVFTIRANPTRASCNLSRNCETAKNAMSNPPRARAATLLKTAIWPILIDANPTRARAAPFSFRKFFLKLRGQTPRARERSTSTCGLRNVSQPCFFYTYRVYLFYKVYLTNIITM